MSGTEVGEAQLLEMLNATRGGFNELVGLTFTRARPEEVVAEIEITERHLQPYGLVHGGVYSTMVETLASTAAAINLFAEGKHCVGLENSTSFLRAARAGKLIGTARPLVRGRRSHVWEVEVHDADARLLAQGRVRMIVLDAGSDVAGKTVGL